MTTGPMTLTRPKPLLRGVSHELAFYASLIASAVLIAWAPGRKAALACAAYGGSLCTLYGVSALYHRPTWSPARRRILQRLDHSAIFLLIAGTYTPVFSLLRIPERGDAPLWIVWIGAAVGIAKSMLWPRAPKPVTAAVCAALGWAVVGDVARLAPVMGPTALTLLVAGGLIYTAGAVVYALRRPDPLPAIFGYHEIFHAMVVVASALTFLHVVHVVQTFVTGAPPLP